MYDIHVCVHVFILYTYLQYAYIYDPGSRFAATPPPPHGMVPKPAFCSILHENVFLARWVAGAVRKPANSWNFLQPTFRKRAICNVSASTSWSSAVSPASMSNYHIILNLLSYSLVNRSDICLYLIPVKLSLRVTSFPYLNSLSFFSWHAPILCCLISTYFISPYQLCCCLLEIGWPRPLPTGPAHSTGESGVSLSIYILNLSYFWFVILFDLVFNIWS